MATNAQVAERDSIRQQLANLRLEIDANVVNTTTMPTGQGVAEAVDLQGAYMVSTAQCSTTTQTLNLLIRLQDLLMYFISIGGVVQAVPVYHVNCSMPYRLDCRCQTWIMKY